MTNRNSHSAETDRFLVQFEKWLSENPQGSFDSYAEEHDVPSEVADEIRDFLKLESELFQAGGLNDVSDLSGKKIGNYQILEKLGAGGMGTVWLADQTSPVKRKVAIKLLTDGVSRSGELARRLELEAQVLANLDHPNVAKVLDAGKTEENVPFFVMEFIDGVSITDYCQRKYGGDQKDSLRNRLQLFQQVCDAVQHIHQKSLLHRDIKPSNVIVTEVNGKPQVKVIDLGLAKVVQNVELVALETTDGTGLLGSPLWMSPEQVGSSPGTDELGIDTRSDIYSLGALLYELLTGTSPLEAFRRSSSKFELLKAVVEADFERPSLRLASVVAKKTDFKLDAVQDLPWAGELKRDLDWIVMKALSKERNRRYSSVGAFAEDVDRFLNGEPVLARTPSFLYRAGKLVSRNKSLVTSLALMFAGLAIATGVSTYYATVANAEWHRAEDERAKAEDERAKADKEREKAEFEREAAEKQREIAEEERRFAENFIAFEAQSFGSLNVANPGVQNDLFKRQFLLLRQKQVDEFDWSAKPKEELAFRQALAASLDGAGFADIAIEELTKVASLSEQVFGPNKSNTISSKVKLANSLFSNEQRYEAKEIVRECEAAVEVASDLNDRCRMEVELAGLRLALTPDLERLENLTVEVKDKFGSDSDLYVDSMSQYASTLFRQGFVPRSTDAYAKALEASKTHFGDHVKTMDLQLGYWKSVVHAMQPEKADNSELTEFVASVKSKFDERHGFTLRAEEIEMEIKFLKGDVQKDVASAYEGLIKKFEEVFGKESLRTTWFRFRVGQNLVINNVPFSIEPFEACLPSIKGKFGLESREYLFAQFQIADYDFLHGRLAECGAIIDEYYPIARKHLGKQDSITLEYLLMKGTLEGGQYNFTDAMEMFLRGAELANAEGHQLIEADFWSRVAECYVRQDKRPDLAEEAIQKCINLRSDRYGADHRKTREAQAHYLTVLMMLEDYEKAEAIADQLLDSLSPEMLMKDEFLEAKVVRLECILEKGAYEEAETLAEKLRKESESGTRGPHAGLVKTRCQAVLGVCKFEAGQKEEGRQLVKGALDVVLNHRFRDAFLWYENRLKDTLDQMED